MTVNKKQPKKAKRVFSCSFCYNEGHTINNCNDERIDMLENDIKENTAVDMKINLNTEYLHYHLQTYTKEELLVIGYKNKLNVKTTYPINDIITTIIEFYTLFSDEYDSIIQNMNITELDYFINKIHQMLLDTNNNTISLSEIQSSLYEYQREPRLLDINVNRIENIICDSCSCSICNKKSTTVDSIISNCNHVFCYDCIYTVLLEFQKNNTTDINCTCCVSKLETLTVSSLENEKKLLNICNNEKEVIIIDEDFSRYYSYLFMSEEYGDTIINLLDVIIKNGQNVLYILLFVYVYQFLRNI